MINATEAVVDYLHESRGLDRVEAIQEIHEVESEIEHQETTLGMFGGLDLLESAGINDVYPVN